MAGHIKNFKNGFSVKYLFFRLLCCFVSSFAKHLAFAVYFLLFWNGVC